ncbi:hypothetical protein [Streptomyces sp. NPDC012508]|uniref:hypothetical protein n=1 Tax=Streptomyces sp. NPDC012508 TaxID=3364837 RepID=UPI0036CE03BA
MTYGPHRIEGAPALGALPGQKGPFGRWPEPGVLDDTDTDTVIGESAAEVPVPRDGSGR